MANLYDLKKFDLNLLVIFECIYQHLSITKAAETLFITPSAVSQSLQRLRTQLNDPLFVRSGKGITPTTISVDLHHHLEKNLNQLEQTINIANHSELTKRFVIYSPQLFTPPETLLLINELYEDGNLQIEHRDLLISSESAENLIAWRKADLIYSLAPITTRNTLCQPYQEIEMALVCRKNHPRITQLTTVESISQERFIYYISHDAGIKNFQAQYNKLFTDRNFAFRSDSPITILNMLNQSNFLGFVPKHVLNTFETAFNLYELPLPRPIPPLTIYIIYNRMSLNTPKFADFIARHMPNKTSISLK